MREKEKTKESFLKTCMDTLSFAHSLLIYNNLVCKIFIKILIIMSIPINAHRSYVCNPLGSFIVIFKNFIYLIMFIG